MNYIVIVRGKLKNSDEKHSKKIHDATIDLVGPMGRSLGNTGHRAYLNPQNRREFLAIDSWNNIEGPQKLLNDPKLAEEFGKLFDGMPEVTILEEAGWKSW